MPTEMWPREVYDERARNEAKAALEAVLRPSEERLIRIYSSWARKSFLTVEEAAVLIMGTDPSAIGVKDSWPVEDRMRFDLIADFLRRKFRSEVDPGSLRRYAPTIGIENSLFWSAIDHYQLKQNPASAPDQEKPIRQSDKTKKDKTRDNMLFVLAKEKGYQPGTPNKAVKIIHDKVVLAGISMDQDTIRNHLKELAKDFVFEKVEKE